MMMVERCCRWTPLLCLAVCAINCGGDSTCEAEPSQDVTSLVQVKQSLTLGGRDESGDAEEGTCRKSALRINQYTHYCQFHVKDQDGMGTDGISAHANSDRLHIQGVLSLKGQCPLLISHAIQLFEKDLVNEGILRVGKITLDFAPDKASIACNCYTRAAYNLGFRKLVIDESGQDASVRKLEHNDHGRRTNGFPIDCYAFPLGAAESGGLRALWTFSDRLDYDIKDTSYVMNKHLKGGRDKVMDHAQYVVGPAATDDPGQLPVPRSNSGMVTAR